MEIRNFKSHTLYWLIVLFFLIHPAPVSAIDVHEETLVTAFLYNFAKFTEWPQQLLAVDDVFVFCIEKQATIRSSLKALSNRRVKGRQISVRTIVDAESISGCHLVYFESDSKLLKNLRIESIAALLVGKEVKTTDIMLTRIDDTLQFTVRPGRAERHGLQFRSQLLSIATRTIFD